MTLVKEWLARRLGDRGVLAWSALIVGVVASIGWLLLPFGSVEEGVLMGRVERDLERIARVPHPTLSQEVQLVRDYLVEQLDISGVSVSTQTFDSGDNVLALLRGTNSTGIVLLAAHYDSVPQGPGASDDGVAVAALVETARVMSREPARNDVLILLTAAEESGLGGSRAFVDEHPLAQDVKVYLNFEARGTSGPPIMFETRRSSPWLLGRYLELPRPFSSSAIVASYLTIPRDLRSRFATDVFNFERIEAAGLNFALVKGSRWYHTPDDSLQNVSWSSARHVVATATRAASMLGDQDLSKAHEGMTTVWFTILGLGVTYPHKAAFALLAVALGTSMLLATRPAVSLRARDIAVGFVGQPIAFLGSLALGGLTLLAVTLLGGDMLLPLADSVLGLAFASLVIGGVVLAQWRAVPAKWWSEGRLFGGLVWWLLIACATSLLLPASSYLWVLPVTLSGLGGLIGVRASRTGWLLRLSALTVASILVTDLTVVAFLAGPSIAFLFTSSLFASYIWFMVHWTGGPGSIPEP